MPGLQPALSVACPNSARMLRHPGLVLPLAHARLSWSLGALGDVWRCLPVLQLSKNYIESYGSAFLLGSNTNAQTPFNYANSNNINITANTILNSQFGVLTLESGGTIMMANNKFTNVMCSAGTQNTRSFSWQVPYTPIQVMASLMVSDDYPIKTHFVGLG